MFSCNSKVLQICSTSLWRTWFWPCFQRSDMTPPMLEVHYSFVKKETSVSRAVPKLLYTAWTRMLCILKNLSGGPFYFRPCCCSYHQCNLYFTADTQSAEYHLAWRSSSDLVSAGFNLCLYFGQNDRHWKKFSTSRQRSSLMWLQLSNKAIWLNISPHTYRIKLCPCALSNRVCLHRLLHAVFFDCAQMLL